MPKNTNSVRKMLEKRKLGVLGKKPLEVCSIERNRVEVYALLELKY